MLVFIMSMWAYFSGLKYKGKEIYTNGFKVLI